MCSDSEKNMSAFADQNHAPSLTCVRLERDNTCYEPDKMPMEGIGMYEGYTHMANLFMSKTNNIDEEKIWQVLDEEPEIDGGITHLATGDLVLRIFGYRAQKLQKIAEKSDMLPPLKSLILKWGLLAQWLY